MNYTFVVYICYMTVFGAGCVLFEMFEETLKELSHLKFFHGKLKVHHGVLLLTSVHVIHALDELLDHYQEIAESREEEAHLAHIHSILAKQYSSEEAAARAYDKAACLRYGRGVPLNFELRPR